MNSFQGHKSTLLLSRLFRRATSSQNVSRSLRLYHDRRKGEFTYFQGQIGEGNKREYFYYIDHQGMLFLDDAKMKNFTSCYKEKQFLRFFFRRLKANDSGVYAEVFPFVSPCGPERNFVRCDDTPIVFTAVLQGSSSEPLLSYNHGAQFLTRPFEPSKICMFPESGRVYHPADEKVGGVGLIADKLSILWTQEQRFIFGNGNESPPTEFKWNNECVKLTNELVKKIKIK